MTGSIAAIVSLGFGTWGSPGLIVTIGYGSGVSVTLVTGAPTFCAGTVFIPGPQRGAVFVPGAKKGKAVSGE